MATGLSDLLKRVRVRYFTWLVALLSIVVVPDGIGGGDSAVGEVPLVFQNLELIEEIDTTAAISPVAGAAPGTDAATRKDQRFREFPQGISRVEAMLGGKARVLPNDVPGVKYYGYLLGKGKQLRANELYVLEVEYPEDKARSIVINNRGCETIRGFYTANAVGDALNAKYVSGNPESLEVPLSQRFERSQMLMTLQARTSEISWKRMAELPRDAMGERTLRPQDGFWVYVSQFDAQQDPLSHGAAVSKIRLYKAPAFEALAMKVNYPPAGLPRRHLFFREEMADDVVGSAKKEKNGFDDAMDWYVGKAKLLRFLGMNVLAKDLLEFGANQGWDSTKFGGNSWVYQTPYPDRWGRIVDTALQYELGVLPYYEYAGSKGERGLGPQRRAIPLGGGPDYTHITWGESARADLTDPDTFEDFRKMLEITVMDMRSRADFIGVWLRPRGSQLPVSFSDAALKRFAEATKQQGAVTREELRSNKKLYGDYIAWWFGMRRDFLVKIRNYLRYMDAGGSTRGGVGPGIKDALVLYTADPSEPGAAQPGGKKQGVVAEDPAAWLRIAGRNRDNRAISLAQALRERWSYEAQTQPHSTWDKWEWQHAVPRQDPEAYRTVEGVMPTYSFNRAYTVGDAAALAAFETPSGMAMIRHYPLNEDMMRIDKGKNGKDFDPLGYFTADMDRAGPFIMLAEARAMANGNPTELGYLSGNNFNRAFPQYVRRFNAAFLSLPALPSTLVERAASHPDVVVRRIDGDAGRPGTSSSSRTPRYGTWLAVVNTGYVQRKKVAIQLPVPVPSGGRVVNAATGETLPSAGGVVTLDLYPCELVSLHIQLRL